jgi:hypothetical protein
VYLLRIGEKYKMKIRYVFHPNLPQNRVNTVLIGEKYQQVARLLENMGIITISIGDNNAVSPNISNHADVTVFHAGQNRLIVSETAAGGCSRLIGLGFQVLAAKKPEFPKYPEEASLNACLVGNRLFHLTRVTDKNILDQASKNNWTIINVNQGYTKCSVCVLDENHIITADMGIHKAALRNKIDSLLISPGQIELDGYHEGFIGGACGKISKDEIVFTGTLKYHKDGEKIIGHIRSLGIRPIFLSNEPCYDIGSIIPLIECD